MKLRRRQAPHSGECGNRHSKPFAREKLVDFASHSYFHEDDREITTTMRRDISESADVDGTGVAPALP
jgi:hypothetical protein